MIELWASIPGYEGRYEVSDFGRVRSLDRQTPKGLRKGIVLVATPDGHGYPQVGLFDGTGLRGRRMARVHALVLAAFVGPRPEGMECLHADNDKTNTRLTNLSYGTPEKNRADAVRTGAILRGSAQPRSKLSCQQVELIRKSTDTNEATGRRFGISGAQVSRIKNGVQRRHG